MNGVKKELVVETGDTVMVDDQSIDKIVLQDGARADVVVLCDEMTDVSVEKFAVVGAGAVLNWHVAVVGGNGLDFKVQSHVKGTTGQSNINMMFFGDGNSNVKLFAGNIFDARNCTGKIMCKGVVQDKAYASFTGEIDITLEGGGTDSYLKEDVLMLDPTAKINAIPSLEIKTNDVKAGHGVSIERLTDEKLFYMMSRGISRDEAKRLTVDGFLRSVYMDFPSRGIVDKIIEKLSYE